MSASATRWAMAKPTKHDAKDAKPARLKKEARITRNVSITRTASAAIDKWAAARGLTPSAIVELLVRDEIQPLGAAR